MKNRKIQLTLRFFKGAKRYFIVAVIASFITTVFNSLTPQIFRFTIDSVLDGDKYPYLAEHLWVIAGALVGVAMLSGAAMFFSRFFTARAGENFAENMRNALYAHVQRLPSAWHDKNQTGDIIQRCTSDVEVIRNFVVTQLLEVFRTVFLIGVSFVVYEQKIIRYCTSICSCYCSIFGSVLPSDCKKIYRRGRGGGGIVYCSSGKCNGSARCPGIWKRTV